MATIPGTNVPTTVTGTGVISRPNGVAARHLFDGGIEKPAILKTLLEKFPNFYLTSLLDKIESASFNGSDKGVQSQKPWAWNIMGRTRRSATASSISDGTTDSATVTTDVAYTSANAAGYWLVGDTIYIPNSGARARVDAVGVAGGFQTITISRIGGGNWSTTLLNTGFKLGHIGSIFGEGSTRAGFRSYLPDQEYNVPSILRRGINITRSMLDDVVWVDDNTYYYKQEDFEHRELLRDIEATIFFGSRVKTSSAFGVNASRGLLEYAEGSGKFVGFSSAIGAQEADLSYLIEQLVPQQGASDLVLLCGEKLLADANRTLSTNYRSIPNSEKPAQLAGLDFQSYQFLGKKLHLAYYEVFSDDAIVPQVTAGASAIDFRNFGIALDFGLVSGGERNIQLAWVERLNQKEIPGMASDGNVAASTYDGKQLELLTEFMPVVYAPNRLGIIRSNS